MSQANGLRELDPRLQMGLIRLLNESLRHPFVRLALPQAVMPMAGTSSVPPASLRSKLRGIFRGAEVAGAYGWIFEANRNG